MQTITRILHVRHIYWTRPARFPHTRRDRRGSSSSVSSNDPLLRWQLNSQRLEFPLVALGQAQHATPRYFAQSDRQTWTLAHIRGKVLKTTSTQNILGRVDLLRMGVPMRNASNEVKQHRRLDSFSRDAGIEEPPQIQRHCKEPCNETPDQPPGMARLKPSSHTNHRGYSNGEYCLGPSDISLFRAVSRRTISGAS